MYIDLCDDDNDKYDEIHQTNQCTLLHSESKASTTTEQKIEDQTTSALSNSAKTISRNNPKLQIENQKAQSKPARGHYKAYETSIIFDISLEGSELIIGFNKSLFDTICLLANALAFVAMSPKKPDPCFSACSG